MRRLLIVLATLVAGVFAAASAAHADDTAFNLLAADYQAYALGQDPIAAAQAGDRKALAKLPDVSPGADALRKSFLEEFRDRLTAIDPGGLSPETRSKRDLLAATLAARLKSLGDDQARLPFDTDSGFDLVMPQLAATTRLAHEDDALAWIARLKAIPRYYAANIENARRGVAAAQVRSAATAETVLARAKAAAATPVETDVLLKPFDGAAIPMPRLTELGLAAATVIRDQVRPAQAAFVTFLQTEYLPAARKLPQRGGKLR